MDTWKPNSAWYPKLSFNNGSANANKGAWLNKPQSVADHEPGSWHPSEDRPTTLG